MPSSGQLLPDCTTPPGLPQQTSRRACEELKDMCQQTDRAQGVGKASGSPGTDAQ